jgi:hypothetical protein
MQSRDFRQPDAMTDITAPQTNHCRSGFASRPLADRELAARMLEHLRIGDYPVPRKLRRITAAVRADRYENALKLDIALERMLEETVGL